MDLNHLNLKIKIGVRWSVLPLIHKIYMNVISAPIYKNAYDFCQFIMKL